MKTILVKQLSDWNTQSIPLDKIHKYFVEEFEIMIRSPLRKILELPSYTPNSMLYYSNKVKGLSLYRVEWEIRI